MMFSSVILTNIQNVSASGGLSITPSSKSVTTGDTVTFTVSASSDYFIEGLTVSVGSGGTITKSLSRQSIDGLNGETATFTVKFTSSTTVTVSGTSASYSTETETSASASANITVTAPQNNTSNSNSNSNTNSKPNTNTNSNTHTSEDTRSSVNTLSSLSVSEGTLSPEFSANTTSYKVDLTSETKTIEISAKVKDSKATVSGTGKHELKIGENNIVITVKAENGNKKTYTISIYVIEKPTIYLEFNGQKLGVLNDYSKVDIPKGFEKSSSQIDNQEISILKSETMGISLIYLTDNENNAFYLFENGQVLRQYETIIINNKTYVLLNIPEDIEKQDGLVRQKVKIGDLEIEGWIFEDQNHQNYSVVYLMNEAGEKQLYSYEGTEGTLQKYVPYVQEDNHMMTYIFIATTIVFMITTVVMIYIHMSFKKKSIASIKEYYDRKNQGN